MFATPLVARGEFQRARSVVRSSDADRGRQQNMIDSLTSLGERDISHTARQAPLREGQLGRPLTDRADLRIRLLRSENPTTRLRPAPRCRPNRKTCSQTGYPSLRLVGGPIQALSSHCRVREGDADDPG